VSASELRVLRDGADWAGARVLLSPEAEDLCHTLIEPRRRPRSHVVIDDVETARLAAPVSPPWLDDDGLLHFRGTWVAVPDSQAALASLLVQRFQTTVRDHELVAVHGAERLPADALGRLGRRVARCNLALRRVRLRGYILDDALLFR
jgi:hypothetical protein